MQSTPQTRRAAAAAAAVLLALVLGVVVLSLAPDAERLPAGGRAVSFVGIALAWGFVAAGVFAWLRRPDNRTGLLMVAVGLATATTGLQFADAPLPFLLGALTDSLIVAVLVHLLLAFPSGRLETRAARVIVAAGYLAATVLHVARLLSAFALLPAAFVLGLVRGRFFRTAAVGRLIERLTVDPGALGVRDALRSALGDPTLTVA